MNTHRPITLATRASLLKSIQRCREQTTAGKGTKADKARSMREWDRTETSLWATPISDPASTLQDHYDDAEMRVRRLRELLTAANDADYMATAYAYQAAVEDFVRLSNDVKANSAEAAS